MFRNRAILVKLHKTDKDVVEEYYDDRLIEDKTAAVLQVLERVAIKAFAGVCIYVLLDTHRKVAVAKAVYRPR